MLERVSLFLTRSMTAREPERDLCGVGCVLAAIARGVGCLLVAIVRGVGCLLATTVRGVGCPVFAIVRDMVLAVILLRGVGCPVFAILRGIGCPVLATLLRTGGMAMSFGMDATMVASSIGSVLELGVSLRSSHVR